MTRFMSRITVGAAALLATAAAVVVAGASAQAEVTSVSVAAGPEGLAVGCRYTVTAAVTDAVIPPGTVFFMVAGGVIPGNGERLPAAAVHHPENNTVTVTWTPTRVGAQNLVAIQSEPGRYTSSQYIAVDVRHTGIDTGSSCQVIG
ncbi:MULTISPECIES: hypothetical protein [Nocardia]|uniref:hypothetical protein n=1 Tax=Nocardia TaxID=1817 RepID=UPI000D685E7D|nr:MULTISPECIES: hypothetical protein [Nocardia]